jgi:hypothetical protein
MIINIHAGVVAFVYRSAHVVISITIEMHIIFISQIVHLPMPLMPSPWSGMPHLTSVLEYRDQQVLAQA